MPKLLPDHLRVLAETSELILGHVFEDAFLIAKQSGTTLLDDSFYGNPACGCISPTNQWAVVAGEHIAVWRKDYGTTIIAAKEWVHGVRCSGDTQAELLTDPWGQHPAIWRLDVLAATLTRVRDFFDYQDQPYTEQVAW